MPLYEYECKNCGHRFERIQSFSAESVKECPVCHGEVERLISAPAVRFKGSGFYSTDYGAKPAKAGAQAAEKLSEGGADGSSEKSVPKTSSGEKSSPAKTEAASSPAPAASNANSSKA